jgi:GMP synthase-like glutamine amidotransferase
LDRKKIRVAVIDLYNNQENRDIGCIRDLLRGHDGLYNNIPVDFEIFNTRHSSIAPDTGFDIYISSGGPGSPFDGSGSLWESEYFSLLDSLWSHNQNNSSKKYFFFICHSFQIMARYFNLADVIKRSVESIGAVPVNMTDAGRDDIIFSGLANPFFGADFRQWQVINPDQKNFDELGARILAVEGDLSTLDSRRALMAVRINNEFAGTQFHPEVGAPAMRLYLNQPFEKNFLISGYGPERYLEMLESAEAGGKIEKTHKTVLPNFLKHAIEELRS